MNNQEHWFSGSRLISVLIKIAYAWSYAWGVTQLVLISVQLPSERVKYGIYIFILLIVLAVLTWQRYSLLIFAGILLVGAATVFFTGDSWQKKAALIAGEAREFVELAIAWFGGQAPGSSANLQILALLICCGLTLFSYFVLARFNLPFLALLLLVAVGVFNSSADPWIFFPWLFLSGIAVIAALARKQSWTYHQLLWRKYQCQARFMIQSLPVAALSLVLAFGFSRILPPALFHSNYTEGLIDDIADLFITPQSTPDQSQEFSIGAFGFYPLIERLGGPVSLSSQPVMQIDGYPQALLLRGAVSTLYDGQHWIRIQNNETLRFDSPLWKREQISAFNLDLPDFSKLKVNRSSLTAKINYRLTPIDHATKTIFLAGRPFSIIQNNSDQFQLYFDADGQLFSKYWLMPGQSVELQTNIFTDNQPGYQASLLQTQAGQLEADSQVPEEIRQNDLQLPDRAEYQTNGELNQIVRDLIGQEKNPYGKVRLLREYLMQNCQYNLHVSVPPADVDFVSWFLQTKEGYCVYFATALTMMCRLSGVPARFVEGFYAPSSNQPGGSRTISGKNAHAWTEVYLNGLGWVPVDATPGDSSPQPGPSPIPSATITSMPTDKPATPQASISPAISPGAENSGDPANTAWIVWGLLFLFLMPIGFFFRSFWLYQKRHQPEWLKRHFPDERQRGFFYWQEIVKIFKGLGIQPLSGETPHQLIDRIYLETNWLAGRKKAVGKMLIGAEKILYSQHAPSAEELAALESIYLLLELTLLQNKNWILFVLRRICYH